MRSATGALSSIGGAGAVRVDQRYDVGPAQVWSALTDPQQLASWYGQVTGDLRPGGHFRVRLDGPDIDSTGRVLECRPPSVLRIRSKETDESARCGGGEPFDETVDVTVHQDSADTVLVAEVGGLPLAKLAA